MSTSDGARLDQLLGKRNRTAFAREHGIKGGLSMISQHVSGNRPISVEAAIAYARGLGVAVDAVSPDTAALLRASMDVLGPPTTARTVRAPTIAEALPVVLDALAAAPERAELRRLLPLLADTDAAAYRQRLAELLGAGGATPKRHSAAA